MKAVLAHVGIAVADLPAALTFYRDALGLDVEVPEDVVSQKVRIRYVSLGPAALELLEATGDDTVIGRFLARHGAGLHHVTLRVDDLATVLAGLRARGVRLVDEEPRPGAGGALVAFIHPAAAQGVLIELTQPPPPPLRVEPRSLTWGDLELTSLCDGGLRLDGGAMFGVVPRPLWERRSPPDDRHRIQLAMRPLLVSATWGALLVDCGAGDKMDARQRDIYGLDGGRRLDRQLDAVGMPPDRLPALLATHLHFDHFGGATRRDGSAVRPAFANARYLIRAAEWEDATHPHERNRASYLQDDFVPLHDAGVVDFYPDDHDVRPGVRVVRTGGHTGQHQVVYLESGGRTAIFAADLIPTVAHIQDPWVMGYDLFPMETLAVKKRVIREAIAHEHLVFFEHDPLVAAGYIRESDNKRYVEPVL